MDKEDVVHAHTHTYTNMHTHTMECYLAMDLEDMMLSEISQTDKDKRCMKPPICGMQTNATNE